MIIFGTKGITSTPEKGEFYCPSCNSQQGYGLKRVRRFFTLYFIPIIPLDKLGEYVECMSCRDTYKANVLDFDPSGDALVFEVEYHAAVKKIMIHMLLADGVIDDSEVETAREIYVEITGRSIDTPSFLDEVRRIETSGEDLADCLLKLQGSLNYEGKESVVKAAVMVAMADGEFHQDEADLLERIGDYLGVTSAHLKGIIASI